MDPGMHREEWCVKPALTSIHVRRQPLRRYTRNDVHSRSRDFVLLSARQAEGQVTPPDGQQRTENHSLGHRHGGQGKKSVGSNPEQAPRVRGCVWHPRQFGNGPRGIPAKSVGDAPMAGRPRAVPCVARMGIGRDAHICCGAEWRGG